MKNAIKSSEKSLVVKFGKGKKQFMPVASLLEASKVCREFIEANNFGCSNWYGTTGSGGKDVGCIYDAEGNFVARVSYNGRIWQDEELGKYNEVPAEVAAKIYYQEDQVLDVENNELRFDFEFNSEDSVKEFIQYTLDKNISLHPDDSFHDLVDDNRPTFTPEIASKYDEIMDRAHAYCRENNLDIYEIGMYLYGLKYPWC